MIGRIYKYFIDNFNEASRTHILERDFYNLTKEDKFEIAKETFYDIVNELNTEKKFLLRDEVSNNWETDYYDNVTLKYMEMLG